MLRVEDTDQTRFTEESLKTILQGLDWLGIEFDGDPLYQSHNIDAHRRAAQQFLESGHAYHCYCTPEELEAKRKQAQSEKRTIKYDGTCRDLSPEQRAAREAQGLPGVVRFRVPPGETVWTDLIRGVQRWDNEEIGDFVVLRADGSPVYQLAVVVDDHEMGVTLVMRGADHLSNTPKQILMFRALGWDVPQYAHNSFTLGPDKKKLSKRHGATTVTEYRDRGYLPEAFYNFLALLGWSPDDGREFFTRDELIDAFTIEGMTTKDAVFDEKKLEWLSSEHLRAMSSEELAEKAAEFWIREGWLTQEEADSDPARISKMAGLTRERIRTVNDFPDFGYFFRDPESYDEKARRKHWRSDTPARVEALVSRLEELESLDVVSAEGATRTVAGELGISASRLIHPTRLALSGVPHGPGLFELMEVLGKETCIRRMRKALGALSSEAPGDPPQEAGRT